MNSSTIKLISETTNMNLSMVVFLDGEKKAPPKLRSVTGHKRGCAESVVVAGGGSEPAHDAATKSSEARALSRGREAAPRGEPACSSNENASHGIVDNPDCRRDSRGPGSRYIQDGRDVWNTPSSSSSSRIVLVQKRSRVESTDVH